MACLIVPRQLHFRCPENPFECVHQDTFMLCIFPAPRQWPGSTVSHDARRRIRHAHLSITNHRTINRSLRCAALILINRCTRIPSGRPLALIKRIVGNCLPTNLNKATYNRTGFIPNNVLVTNRRPRRSAGVGRITPGRVGNRSEKPIQIESNLTKPAVFFLLPRGRFRPALTHGTRAFLSTG